MDGQVTYLFPFQLNVSVPRSPAANSHQADLHTSCTSFVKATLDKNYKEPPTLWIKHYFLGSHFSFSIGMFLAVIKQNLSIFPATMTFRDMENIPLIKSDFIDVLTRRDLYDN